MAGLGVVLRGLPFHQEAERTLAGAKGLDVAALDLASGHGMDAVGTQDHVSVVLGAIFRGDRRIQGVNVDDFAGGVQFGRPTLSLCTRRRLSQHFVKMDPVSEKPRVLPHLVGLGCAHRPRLLPGSGVFCQPLHRVRARLFGEDAQAPEDAIGVWGEVDGRTGLGGEPGLF